MAKYAFQVEIPKLGDLNREQAWASLDKVEGKLKQVMRRTNALGSDAESVFSEEEIEDLRAIRARLDSFAKRIGQDPLDALAEIKKPKYKSEPNTVKFPDEIREILHDWHGEVYRFERRGGSKIQLALALLEDSGFEPNEIHKIVRDNMSPDYKHGDVWTCYDCEEASDPDNCETCYGWGYVWGERPS